VRLFWLLGGLGGAGWLWSRCYTLLRFRYPAAALVARLAAGFRFILGRLLGRLLAGLLDDLVPGRFGDFA
jgi:hypothetical protein